MKINDYVILVNKNIYVYLYTCINLVSKTVDSDMNLVGPANIPMKPVVSLGQFLET